MHNVLIVIVAVIMGVSPLPTTPQHQPVVDSGKPAIVQQERKESVASKPKSEETKKPAEVKSTAKKEQTWQDNPQKCNQETQYISKEAPFKCIDKPVAQAQTSQPAAKAISGDKYDWLRASGIPESEWTYVDYIVGRESGWNPCAYNPGMSDCNANPTSACGLAQSLPCGKQSKYGHWTDPVANLKWQYEYVKGRYGGYAQAYAFWTANHWY